MLAMTRLTSDDDTLPTKRAGVHDATHTTC